MVHVFPPSNKPYPISFKSLNAWEHLLGGPFNFVKTKLPTHLLVVPKTPMGSQKNEAATEMLEDQTKPIIGLCLFVERLDVRNERWASEIQEITWAN